MQYGHRLVDGTWPRRSGDHGLMHGGEYFVPFDLLVVDRLIVLSEDAGDEVQVKEVLVGRHRHRAVLDPVQAVEFEPDEASGWQCQQAHSEVFPIHGEEAARGGATVDHLSRPQKPLDEVEFVAEFEQDAAPRPGGHCVPVIAVRSPVGEVLAVADLRAQYPGSVQRRPETSDRWMESELVADSRPCKWEVRDRAWEVENRFLEEHQSPVSATSQGLQRFPVSLGLGSDHDVVRGVGSQRLEDGLVVPGVGPSTDSGHRGTNALEDASVPNSDRTCTDDQRVVVRWDL